MPTIRQIRGPVEALADRKQRATVVHDKPGRRLRLVSPATSAIEYIVQTAQPGEVVHVTDEDYYNTHLWNSYLA